MRGLLWLWLGLYMDFMYAHSCLTWPLLHEDGEVNWGPLATDCIQVWLGLQESSTCSPDYQLLLGRFGPSNPRLSYVTLLQRTVLISVVPAA